ncbi:MAG: GNAT family N-acetyltransferase [Actinomycetota bacterium]
MSVVERIRRRGQPEQAPIRFGDGALTVEPMQRRDLRAGVLDVERAAYPTGWSQRVFQSELDQMRTGARHYVVARPGRGDDPSRPRPTNPPILGHAGLMFVLDEAHVTTVAVRPDQRRSGAASRMLLVLAEEALRRGTASWTLEVRAGSVGAQQLYRRFGFAPAGVRKGYYEAPVDRPGAPREDAIVMWCHDIRSADYRRRLDDLWEQYR